TGRDIAKLCFEGSDEELLSTLNQQPTIHTVEIATLRAIEEAGIKPDMAAGFSLGEYGALVAANTIDFEDIVQLVSKRAKFIQDVVVQGVGKMVAILDLDCDKVEETQKKPLRLIR
ncbi:MAG: acyltransferase domain-containing protein, partial [Aerococcus sp.]|nr:acyltransferase domain-containing protein [Aerococcus sp.]